MSKSSAVSLDRQSQVTELVNAELELLSRADRAVWLSLGSGLPTALALTYAAGAAKVSIPVLTIIGTATLLVTAAASLLTLARDSRRRRRSFTAVTAKAIKWLESFTNTETLNALIATPYLKGRLVDDTTSWRWLLKFVSPEVLREAMDKTIEQGTFTFGSYLYYQVTDQYDRRIIHYNEADDLEDVLKALIALGDLSNRGYRLLCTGHNYSVWHNELDKKRSEQLSQVLGTITVSV
jgi:hypothetical protein